MSQRDRSWWPESACLNVRRVNLDCEKIPCHRSTALASLGDSAVLRSRILASLDSANVSAIAASACQSDLYMPHQTTRRTPADASPIYRWVAHTSDLLSSRTQGDSRQSRFAERIVQSQISGLDSFRRCQGRLALYIAHAAPTISYQRSRLRIDSPEPLVRGKCLNK